MSIMIPHDPDASSPFDEIKEIDETGKEYWSARRLQPLMGYRRWENLTPALNRAMATARNQGVDVDYHFLGSQENPSDLGGRPSKDYRLTRFAAYLLTMNGDPNKPEVASAQAYFATQTRRAEVQAKEMGQQFRQMQGQVQSLQEGQKLWTTLTSEGADFSVRTAASILNRDRDVSTGQNNLFKLMRDLGMIDRKNLPYARHKKHVVQKMGCEYRDSETGEIRIGASQVRVTPMGVLYILKRLKRMGQIQ